MRLWRKALTEDEIHMFKDVPTHVIDDWAKLDRRIAPVADTIVREFREEEKGELVGLMHGP